MMVSDEKEADDAESQFLQDELQTQLVTTGDVLKTMSLERQEWTDAAAKEWNSLIDSGTIMLISQSQMKALQQHHKKLDIVPGKAVCSTKFNGAGNRYNRFCF
jgi:hypothetical protein